MSLVREARFYVAMFVDQDAEDADAAATIHAILRNNGEPVQSVEPAMRDEGDNWTSAWPMWARQLDAVLTEAAAAHRAATVAHAEAYLAADGTQQYRAASAELAAAAAVEVHEALAGRAEAYRMVLADRARTGTHRDGGA